jgi:hypothetical protein
VWCELSEAFGEALFELAVESRQLSGGKDRVAVAEHEAPDLVARAEHAICLEAEGVAPGEARNQ